MVIRNRKQAMDMGRAGRRSRYVPLTSSDGPFGYNYVSISAVPGIRLPNEWANGRVVASFPDLGAEALLTNDVEPYAIAIDRGDAIGTMLLTGLLGTSRFPRISRLWRRLSNVLFGEYQTLSRGLARESERCRRSRIKKFQGPGCFLVYRAVGPVLEPAELTAARRVGDIGLAIDAINGETYRARHRRAIQSTATAMSLAISDTTGSPETRFLADTIYLTGPNELHVYCRTVTASALGVVTTGQDPDPIIKRAAITVQHLLQDEKLDGSVSLFVQSQASPNDNLRAFIPAWSAMELLINRLFKVYQEEWVAMLACETVLPVWDKPLDGVPFDKYRMRDRFFAVACVLEFNSAQSDADIFSSINAKRGDYYHRMDVHENDLPTHQTQKLFRKYLRLALTKLRSTEV